MNYAMWKRQPLEPGRVTLVFTGNHSPALLVEGPEADRVARELRGYIRKPADRIEVK